ncbi:MAG: proton-conducting transporter membrane subunit [Fibrobacterota bacterium]
MNMQLVMLLALPALCGAVTFLIPQRVRFVRGTLLLATTLINLLLAIKLFGTESIIQQPWLPYGIDFALRIDKFSTFIVLAVAGFSFLIALYSIAFMAGKSMSKQFFAYLLISLSMVNGATLANNLILLLFFWEGLLATLFGFIVIGNPNAYKTAVKALVLVGISDLCMMFGIGLTGHLAGTLTISALSLPVTGLGSVAFILLMLGAVSKAGCMPFHSWIPDAAIDAPAPFMAFLPAALEKLLGIYFLGRITLQMFQLTPQSWLSPLLMILGGVTILLAVMMALVQKDYKRLLSYHAISQVGYMILGIGTMVPVGIVGGLFHMINHAMYKSCLFLTGATVEKQTGTTDLSKLGGIGRVMPVTFACFIVAAAAISGVPPFNGFFSKELVYDGALERGSIFYIMAVAGSFFTAASFLKLGHAAFLGKRATTNENVKEAPILMLLPMIVIAGFCILFGLYNALPLQNLIQPVVGDARLQGHDYSGLPHSSFLVIMTVLVLAAALLNHLFGVKKTGSGIGAVDHIHHAPVLSGIYDKAEKRWFDPYDLGLKFVGVFSKIGFGIDRLVDWFYDGFAVSVTGNVSRIVSRLHNGSYVTYLLWSLFGVFLVVAYALWAK